MNYLNRILDEIERLEDRRGPYLRWTASTEKHLNKLRRYAKCAAGR